MSLPRPLRNPPCLQCAQDDAVTTPKRIKSTITRASLHIFGRDFGLPISGVGSFDVMYADPDVRVFRSSTNSLAVQVRGDYLAERLA